MSVPDRLDTGVREYAIGDKIASGTIADLYACTFPSDNEEAAAVADIMALRAELNDEDPPDPADLDTVDGVCKIVRDESSNDLAGREVRALRCLRDVPPRFAAFTTRLVDHGQHNDRRYTILGAFPVDGFVPLTAVKRAYPDGIDPRDVAWMWRRLLVAIGVAADAGVAHGSVVPDHVMIHPDEHGLVLVDWCFSAIPGGGTPDAIVIPAMLDQWDELYPQEVRDRQRATAQTDLFMATKTMMWLLTDSHGDLRSDVPDRMAAFARGCTLAHRDRRPANPQAMLVEFDGLLEDLYGPRKFRPFHMPDNP